MFNEILNFFKKKPVKDQVISFDNGQINLKDVLPYKVEPEVDYPEIHTKFIGRSYDNKFEWEINGKTIFSEDIISAQRQYLRITGQEGIE